MIERGPRAPAALLVLSGMLAPASFGQEAPQSPPAPAPELKKLEPMIGHWKGSGTANFDPSAPPTKWECTSTYQWALGGHFVQEDSRIQFDGIEAPMVLRSYLGWDRENGRHVSLMAGNGGEVHLNELTFLPDGSMVQVNRLVRDGMPSAERLITRVTGKTMTFAMDLLPPTGPMMPLVEGTLTRTETGREPALDAGPFMLPPAEPMARVVRSAGTYAMEGSVSMSPEMPPMKIRGTETARALFGGALLHVRTTGAAEGMPETYEAESFMGWNAARSCYIVAVVTNMGEVGTMECRFSQDGKSMVQTGAMLVMGLPAVARYVIELDESGSWKRAVGTSVMGAANPFETFSATYTKKK